MLTIATWNLENLFRNGVDGGPTTPEAYETKLSALARTIDGIGADVVAVQEVGQPEALDDLVARLAPPRSGQWHRAVSAFPDDRGIRVAVLAGFPVINSTDTVNLAAGLDPVQVEDAGQPAGRMGRGALTVMVEPDGQPLWVTACHLKSKLVSYPGGRFVPRNENERARYGAYALFRRAAEATTVRTVANDLLDGRGQERRVVVLGDLNDTDQAATTQILLGPTGSEIGTPGFDRADSGDAWRLWNLAPLIPAERRYSRIFRGRRELIDHILVSQVLVPAVISVETVIDAPLPSVTEDPARRRNAGDSDHAPVVARFR